MATETIPAIHLAPGMTIKDERYFYVMEVGHVVVGRKWVTARAFHPDVNIYPKTQYRFPVDGTVDIMREGA